MRTEHHDLVARAAELADDGPRGPHLGAGREHHARVARVRRRPREDSGGLTRHPGPRDHQALGAGEGRPQDHPVRRPRRVGDESAGPGLLRREELVAAEAAPRRDEDHGTVWQLPVVAGRAAETRAPRRPRSPVHRDDRPGDVPGGREQERSQVVDTEGAPVHPERRRTVVDDGRGVDPRRRHRPAGGLEPALDVGSRPLVAFRPDRAVAGGVAGRGDELRQPGPQALLGDGSDHVLGARPVRGRAPSRAGALPLGAPGTEDEDDDGGPDPGAQRSSPEGPGTHGRAARHHGSLRTRGAGDDPRGPRRRRSRLRSCRGSRTPSARAARCARSSGGGWTSGGRRPGHGRGWRSSCGWR